MLFTFAERCGKVFPTASPLPPLRTSHPETEGGGEGREESNPWLCKEICLVPVVLKM